jgi:K+-sensing histidine kinase KdpD
MSLKYNEPSYILSRSTNPAKLCVKVIDSGIGIDKSRQNLLFKPFMELHQKQDLELVKDNSIGLGLTCSREILRKLGGDIKLVQSENKVTVFGFDMPVDTKKGS